MPMTRSRMLEGTWYDHPEYYDIAFQAYTEREADFIEAACRKYCPFNARRLLEPACGTGRLVTALAARGYEVTGFDLSQPALSYLRRQITRRRLNVTTFEAEMSYFHLRRRVDAAYCTINTFRHLLTEETARSHLNCVAETLRPGGIYILGLHLLPIDIYQGDTERWTHDLRRRLEIFRVCLLVRRGSKELRLAHEFRYRTYTASQFQRLLASVRSLEIRGVYDFRHDVERPFMSKNEVAYALFVLRRRLVGFNHARPSGYNVNT
ncbi:MAG: class I SAM-dependent methyltransferase [Verrucomicrobia bacterium]|nr:MAG: class I SAM-dependent methyltransferase [Verrucomicrobiota bacterium]